MRLIDNPVLKTNLCGMTLQNPLVLASGVMGTSPALLMRVAAAGAGAVTAKSCGPKERAGHPNPVMVAWGHGLLNAIGLTNPGMEKETALLEETKNLLAPLDVPIFASIFAGTVAEFKEVASIISTAQPDMIEVNISCPNVHDDYGLPFAADPKSAAAVTQAVKKSSGGIPVAVKLAPNVPDIGRIAKAVVDAGADAITAINTMPGMIVDADAAKPVLHNRSGGISGPALKPIALRCVAEIFRSVDVPIIGTGGVLTGRDAVEMLMVGASAVGIGSAFWYRGPDTLKLILEEMNDFMKAHNLKSINEVTGKALK